MTKLKMGRHNAITAERFHQIKGALAEGMSADAVMTKYEVKHTTLRYIEISKNFYEYRLRTETLPAARKMPTVIAPSSGLAFEDFSYRKKRPSKRQLEQQARREEEASTRMFGLVAIVAMAVIGMIAVGIIVMIWSGK